MQEDKYFNRWKNGSYFGRILKYIEGTPQIEIVYVNGEAEKPKLGYWIKDKEYLKYLGSEISRSQMNQGEIYGYGTSTNLILLSD